MPAIKTLVVEDFEPFREYVCRELQQITGLEVVSVSDGLAAVHAAEQMRPDLVLLDIGLPKLNGIAAAQRIRALCPESKIVFLTQESSPEVVDAALGLGSRGYIQKVRAHGYLVPAVEAILDGRSRAGAGARSNGMPAQASHAHQAQFCSDDSVFLEGVERFVAPALRSGDAAIVMTTGPHLEALLDRLRRRRVNVDGAIERGTFLSFDAAGMLSQVMSNGVADCDRFRTGLDELIASAARATGRPHPRVAVFGECAALLLASGHVDAAISLEQAGNEILATQPAVDIMCAYPLLPTNPDTSFKRIWAEHGVVAVH